MYKDKEQYCTFINLNYRQYFVIIRFFIRTSSLIIGGMLHTTYIKIDKIIFM